MLLVRLNIDPSLCHFSTIVRVRWADTDAVGIAYNGAYLTYLEVARVEYHRALKAWKLGVPLEDPRVQDHLYDEKVGVYTLASSTLNWISPARVDMRLRIATRVSRVGNSSLDQEYVVTRVMDGGLVALGVSTMVRVDPQTLRPAPLEPELRADFTAFEQALADGRAHVAPAPT
jgi:acyl-CoA thioester hydrolase